MKCKYTFLVSFRYSWANEIEKRQNNVHWNMWSRVLLRFSFVSLILFFRYVINKMNNKINKILVQLVVVWLKLLVV